MLSEIILTGPEPTHDGQSPPSYEEAISDLPPEYSTIPVLARAKVSTPEPAPPHKIRDHKRQAPGQCDPSASIDFGEPYGAREHKKKKGATAKKTQTNKSAGSDNEGETNANNEGQDGGDAGSGGGSAGDGNNGGGGDDGGDGGDDPGDDWTDWATGGSKKKNKKKKAEEEEQRAKEEEEKKAAEAAAATSAANNLSWADETEANADDIWAGFTTAGKKKKDKKGTVRHRQTWLIRSYTESLP